MRKLMRLAIISSVTATAVLLVAWLATTSFSLLSIFLEQIAGASSITVHEGLPHPNHFGKAYADELKTKSVTTLNGHAFYTELLQISEADLKTLNTILQDTSTYEPFEGEKKCGGFHPDYEIQWHAGLTSYRALLCFGCGEVKLIHLGITQRYDLSYAAKENLESLLSSYRKNCPDPNKTPLMDLKGESNARMP